MRACPRARRPSRCAPPAAARSAQPWVARGEARRGAGGSMRPSHEHRQGRYLGEGAQQTPDALVHLVEVGALGQRPLGRLLVRRARVQAGLAARLVRARARARARAPVVRVRLRVAARRGAVCGCEGPVAAVGLCVVWGGGLGRWSDAEGHLVELDDHEAVVLPRALERRLEVLEREHGLHRRAGGGVGRVRLRAREERELGEHRFVLGDPRRRCGGRGPRGRGER